MYLILHPPGVYDSIYSNFFCSVMKKPKIFYLFMGIYPKIFKDCFAFQSQVLDHYPCMFLGMDKHRRSWKNENVQPEPKMNDMFRAS